MDMYHRNLLANAHAVVRQYGPPVVVTTVIEAIVTAEQSRQPFVVEHQIRGMRHMHRLVGESTRPRTTNWVAPILAKRRP